MLRNRIIFTLIHNDGYFMQSRNFRLQKVGDSNWLEKNYKFQEIGSSIDELIILDATRNHKDIDKFSEILKRIRSKMFIPIAAGGGISEISSAEILFQNGADKIVLNSAIINYPDLVAELVNRYGSQSIIASVDYRSHGDINYVYINDGKLNTNLTLENYLNKLDHLNIGEIYLNSIDKDGTGFGYDIETLLQIRNSTSIPLIAAGGAGNGKHLSDGLKIGVSAVATANLFNFMGNSLKNSRIELIESNFNLANWY
jgi:cyclase